MATRAGPRAEIDALAREPNPEAIADVHVGPVGVRPYPIGKTNVFVRLSLNLLTGEEP